MGIIENNICCQYLMCLYAPLTQYQACVVWPYPNKTNNSSSVRYSRKCILMMTALSRNSESRNENGSAVSTFSSSLLCENGRSFNYSPKATRKEVEKLATRCRRHSWQERTNNGNNNVEDMEQKKQRKSVMSLSNVKRKISTTFQRRASINSFPVANKARSPLNRSIAVNKSEESPTRPRQRRRTGCMIEKPSRQENEGSVKVKRFKLYMLGGKSVGKTALSVRFLTGRYIHEYKSSIDEVYSRSVHVGDEKVDVTISESNIVEQKGSLTLEDNTGIIVMYSLIDRQSFLNGKAIIVNLGQLTHRYPVVFIGAKRDLSRVRRVSKKEGFEVASKHNCTHFEVSSANNKKVRESFHSLFRQIEMKLMTSEQEASVTWTPPIL